MNRFFTQQSLTERGTLYWAKEKFNHHSLKKEVMQNFQQVENFLEVGYSEWITFKICFISINTIKHNKYIFSIFTITTSCITHSSFLMDMCVMQHCQSLLLTTWTPHQPLFKGAFNKNNNGC